MPDVEALERENEELRSRIRELEETLDAIRSGEVDAIVVSRGESSQVYALEGADHPYRVLVENIQEGALTLTTTGMVLYANAAFAAMQGLPVSAILGTSLRDHIAPRDRAHFDALLDSSGIGARRGEMSICSGTASIPVQVSLTPLEMNDETRISVVVTDRRQDYGRLRLLARMLNSVADAVTAVDPGGTVIYWNEAAERLYGRPASEMVGRTLADVVEPGIPAVDERRDFEELAAGETWCGEYEARNRDGRSFPVLATRAPVYDEDGKLLAVIGTSRDIGERKRAEETLRESEERFRALYENSRDAIILTDPLDGGRIVAANPAACRMLGWTEEELVGRGREVMFDPADPGVVALVQERGRSGAAQAELMYRRRDGSTFPGEVSTALFTDSSGDVRAVAIVRDVAERKEAEAFLHEYAERLQTSNEELQRFAYVASHDLQEPLRSIVSFSQLLERRYKGQLDADADEFIGFIVDGGNRMQRLIRDLLQVSRIETGAKPPSPTDAGAVVSGALRALDNPIRESGATVTVEALPVVMADASQVEQVFVNLIGNAIKYGRDGVPPEIAVSARKAGSMVEFAVADNGIGIEAEYFGRIFEMFRRLHTHDEYEGTGIGLAVVKKIVERHGGRVRVESRPGEGSTFFFTLPAA